MKNIWVFLGNKKKINRMVNSTSINKANNFMSITSLNKHNKNRGRRGRDRMVVGLTTTCAISAYSHWSCEFESHWWRDVLDTNIMW